MSVQTVFGSIGSIIDQTTNSILKIEKAKAATSGKVPTIYAGAFGVPALNYQNYTGKQLAGIGLLVVVVVIAGYLIWKESNS